MAASPNRPKPESTPPTAGPEAPTASSEPAPQSSDASSGKVIVEEKRTVFGMDSTLLKGWLFKALFVILVIAIIAVTYYAFTKPRSGATTTIADTTTAIVFSSNISTQNSLYVQGSVVYVSGKVAPVPANPTPTPLQVVSPTGAVVVSKSAIVMPDGNFNSSFVTGNTGNWISGNYLVRLDYFSSNSITGFTLVQSQQVQPNTLTGVLCTIYTAVHGSIFLLALVLMLMGGAIYSLAHILPGQHKGSMQNYGMGMVMGGIIAVIIAVLAFYILSFIAGNALPIATCG